MLHPRKGKRRLDYRIFHEQGIKRDLTTMADVRNTMRVRELQICDDLVDAFTLFNLDELDTCEEISEGMTHITELGKQYRHIHVELKELLGDAPYTAAYPLDDDQEEKAWTVRVRQYIRDARTKRKNLEKDPQVSGEKDLDRVRLIFNSEEQAFQDKLSHEIENFEQPTSNIEEIKQKCSRFQTLLDDYFRLLPQARIAYGNEFDDNYKDIFDETVAKIREKIATGNSSILDISRDAELKRAKEEANQQKLLEDTMLKEHTFNAKTLADEIKHRTTTLTQRCKIDGLQNLSDHQILAHGKGVAVVDKEMREILDKFTTLSKIAALCGDKRDTLLTDSQKLKDNALSARNKYVKCLHDLVISRDITEEKLRTSDSLTINLSKFQGYDSPLDIYSFKSEFEKLVQPRVVKTLWLHHLKNNYLDGPALVLVDKLDTIQEAWKALISAYGNVKLLLQNKLSGLDDLECLEKMKGDEKIMLALAKIINAMIELRSLAEKHSLENKLYVGGGLEKIYSVIGDERQRKFLSKRVSDPSSPKPSTSDLEEKLEWIALLEFLKKEYSLREKLTLLQKSKETLGMTDPTKSKNNNTRFGGNVSNLTGDLPCHVCGQTGHVISVVRGQRAVDYYSCKKFVDMTCEERKDFLIKKKFCLQCMLPGIVHDSNHRCFTRYNCPDPYHKKWSKGMHILLCSRHKDSPQNIALLAEYKEKVISKRSDHFKPFTKNISLVCGSVNLTISGPSFFDGPSDNVIPDIKDNAGFQLQTIGVDSQNALNLFFDGGCGDLVIKKTAVDILLSIGRAILEVPGPLMLKGVGDKITVSEHGAYSICLPLKNGQNIIMSGICLDRVTTEFQTYSLSKVNRDIRQACKKEGGTSLVNKLPKLPDSVGGDTDILIGSKYLRIHPEKIWMSPTGLTVSDSPFLSLDGSSGVVSGPHPSFNSTMGQGNHAYFHAEVIAYRNAFRICCSMPLLIDKYATVPQNAQFSEFDSSSVVLASQKAPKCLEIFDELDRAGTEVSYRCAEHRDCQDCKRGPRIDAISIQEEIEQEIIEKSVHVDVENNKTTHFLPFLADPERKLVPNKHFASKIYESQIKQLAKAPADRQGAIEFEQKLQKLGFVEYLDNLPEDDQNMILQSPVQYFIPWLVAYNSNSATTPVRLVFDASIFPRGGCSLNSLLAKGDNNMNKLVSILISWTMRKVALHTDIRKMYNSVLLDKSHWKYQLYLWDEGLRPDVPPRIKVIPTAIYGVRSSGNVSQCGVHKTAELFKEDYPEAYRVVKEDFYVDDCFSGADDTPAAHELSEQLTIGLLKGGFVLKGFTFSNCDPPDDLSEDGETVVVGGLRWYPKSDRFSLNIPEMNFAKKKHGRKVDSGVDFSLENLTRRNCASRVAEVFDPLGRVTPLMCGFKLDLHELSTRKLDWDDKIPDELRQIWKDNFEMINEIGSIQYHRTVVPDEAAGLEIETIDTADASQHMICVAIYARFRLRSGGHSCQLVFARSKIVSPNTTQPRAELQAALLNASSGHAVKMAYGDRHKKCWKLTDSQVSLHWLRSKRSRLKLGVRNCTMEINRLSDVNDWRYVESKDMVADIGTRRGVGIADVGPESVWINGLKWMSGDETDFPTKTAEELIEDATIRQAIDKEMLKVSFNFSLSVPSVFHAIHLPARYVPTGVQDRYDFSRYLIDPNRFRFRKVIRVLGLVFLFISKLSRRKGRCPPKLIKGNSDDLPSIFAYQGDQYIVTSGKYCPPGLVVDLSREMINSALRYYFVKATNEVKHFLPDSNYKRISEEKDGILYYSGRILPSQEITGVKTLCDTSFDLQQTTFCVPLIDRSSPIAYALASEVHWHHPDTNHGGIESLLRHTQCVAYLIGGRKLVVDLKKACARCRFLEKRAIRVAMGPKSQSNLTIAPAFYNTQVDICGPFKTYSNVNKRAKTKLWAVIFCCCATGAVDAKTMEDYSTDSFVLAFDRFGTRYGFPSKLFPDYGGQLLKACTDMILSYGDIKNQLSTDYGVDFDTCPVGAHYVHGKVERKIQQVKKSIEKSVQNDRLSPIQWETLVQQIANSINNLPIGLGNKVDNLENLDLLTPNRLLLGRNNDRGPTCPLLLSRDTKRIVETNAHIFQVWFKSWLISYVPTLIDRPKWFDTDKDVSVGDVVLFLKSEKEFEHLYQYGIVSQVIPGIDGLIRSVMVEYQNHDEGVKRITERGVREIVVIHPVDELGISRELHDLANN